MMQSLVNDGEQSGWLPRWPAANDVTYVMGGDSPDAVLSSAYAFGARNFETKKAFALMAKGGTQPGKGPHNGEERPFLAEYMKAGYVPVDKDHIAASRTWNMRAMISRLRSSPKRLGKRINSISS